MPKTFDNPNPHISALEDGALLKQIANQARRALDMADRLKTAPPLSDEQREREEWQARSNALAAENPRYAAARAASANFLVLPLDGTAPIVKPSDATRDGRELFLWWSRWPEANPGILLGRIGGVFALRVEDRKAFERLRKMAAVDMRDDNDRTWTEYREIGGASVRLVAPSSGSFSMRIRGGWGKELDKAGEELARAARTRNPETFWLVYSYPSVISGLDAWDFVTRTVVPGVRVLGEGLVLPWDGAVLEEGSVIATMSTPPTMPLWLANVVGKPRSRRAMDAAREAHDAILRRDAAHITAAILARRAYEEQEREQANKDRERAEKILADVMAKDS